MVGCEKCKWEGCLYGYDQHSAGLEFKGFCSCNPEGRHLNVAEIALQNLRRETKEEKQKILTKEKEYAHEISVLKGRVMNYEALIEVCVRTLKGTA